MPDTLLAIIPRPRLSETLTAFHRDGYGHVTRVLDPDRAPLANQLGRAGVEHSRLADAAVVDAVILLVLAPMRTTAAAALAVYHGAVDVEVVTSGQPVSAAVAPGLIAFAGDRRERRTVRAVDLPQDAPNDVAGVSGNSWPAER
jgi:hypothetical protein